jgi:1-deoxy-D-xylulose-5-phosphate reductoisomerase
MGDGLRSKLVESVKAVKQISEEILRAQPQYARRRKVCVLGSTGSVGRQTVELLEANPDRFETVVLTARNNVELLIEQARKLRPSVAVIGDETKFAALLDGLAGTGVEAQAGDAAIVDAAKMDSDTVMAAIVGAAGLPATLEAVKRGATVAFANKECLVCAGPLMMREVVRHGARLLPVDSEHNAIFQVFDNERRDSIQRLILTASGGPFRSFTLEQMKGVTREQAVKHPVWAMGAKISIDSATMMNKGLEVIEARYLFDMPEDKIDVLVHPQSVVHSMVEYKDGSVLAQLGSPDMRTPIAYSLAWPERMEAPVQRLDLAKQGQLTFEAPDEVRFPALRLAREALKRGDSAPTALNAANECAVEAFLQGKIGFLDIARIVEETVTAANIAPLTDIDSIHAADQSARARAGEEINRCSKD